MEPRKQLLVELYNAAGVGVIIPWPTGVVYSNQVDGVACYQPRVEGFYVPLNDELMNLVRSLDSGNAWAVGRFDVLRSKARLPESMSSQIPPITWFSVSSHVNGGIRGVIRAETSDEQSATNLRDVVRGFMALGRLQAGAKPEYQAMLQSLELGGTGKTVFLSFSVPLQVFDAIGQSVRPMDKPRER